MFINGAQRELAIPLYLKSKLRNGGFLSEGFSAGGGEIDSLSVGLRVMAPNLDLSEVTKLLGVQPTFAARRGERTRSGDGEVVHRTSIWSFALPESPEWELTDAIGTLLAALPSDRAIWSQPGSKAKLDIFCALYVKQLNRGVELPPSLMAQLAERGLSLGLDIYAIRTKSEGFE